MYGIVVYFRRDFKDIRFPVKKLENLVRIVCKRFGIANALVDITVVGNNCMRKLNKQFLNRKTNTDCLSFDLSDARDSRKQFSLIVNGEKAGLEAARRCHSAQAELALYITHGLLHNLGFNDHTPLQATIMHWMEDEILEQQGFGPVYNGRIKIISRRRRKC